MKKARWGVEHDVALAAAQGEFEPKRLKAQPPGPPPAADPKQVQRATRDPRLASEFIKLMHGRTDLPEWVYKWLWKLPPLPPEAGHAPDLYRTLALSLINAMKAPGANTLPDMSGLETSAPLPPWVLNWLSGLTLPPEVAPTGELVYNLGRFMMQVRWRPRR